VNPVFAVTGGIACGKSAAGSVLEELGFAVLDADRVAHELMEPGGAVYRAVADRFGDGFLDSDGRIDRRALGRRVFECPAEREALNRLVHPPVVARCRAWARTRRTVGPGAVLVPLLFEAGAGDGWDGVLCVAASPDTVRSRLAGRGLNPEEIRRRMEAQWPLEEKIRRSDEVIWNDGTFEELRAGVRRAVERCGNRAAGRNGRANEAGSEERTR
jgi:dephospho-CoA kinase